MWRRRGWLVRLAGREGSMPPPVRDEFVHINMTMRGRGHNRSLPNCLSEGIFALRPPLYKDHIAWPTPHSGCVFRMNRSLYGGDVGRRHTQRERKKDNKEKERERNGMVGREKKKKWWNSLLLMYLDLLESLSSEMTRGWALYVVRNPTSAFDPVVTLRFLLTHSHIILTTERLKTYNKYIYIFLLTQCFQLIHIRIPLATERLITWNTLLFFSCTPFSVDSHNIRLAKKKIERKKEL